MTSFLVLFAFLQPIILILLDIPPMLPVLDGVVMELQDCALPLLRGEWILIFKSLSWKRKKTLHVLVFRLGLQTQIFMSCWVTCYCDITKLHMNRLFPSLFTLFSICWLTDLKKSLLFCCLFPLKTISCCKNNIKWFTVNITPLNKKYSVQCSKIRIASCPET